MTSRIRLPSKYGSRCLGKARKPHWTTRTPGALLRTVSDQGIETIDRAAGGARLSARRPSPTAQVRSETVSTSRRGSRDFSRLPRRGNRFALCTDRRAAAHAALLDSGASAERTTLRPHRRLLNPSAAVDLRDRSRPFVSGVTACRFGTIPRGTDRLAVRCAALWARPTGPRRDLDLLRKGAGSSEAAIRRDVESICTVSVEPDAVECRRRLGSSRRDSRHDESAARARSCRRDADAARLRLQIDLGVGDAVWLGATTLGLPGVARRSVSPRSSLIPPKPSSRSEARGPASFWANGIVASRTLSTFTTVAGRFEIRTRDAVRVCPEDVRERGTPPASLRCPLGSLRRTGRTRRVHSDTGVRTSRAPDA